MAYPALLHSSTLVSSPLLPTRHPSCRLHAAPPPPPSSCTPVMLQANLLPLPLPRHSHHPHSPRLARRHTRLTLSRKIESPSRPATPLPPLPPSPHSLPLPILTPSLAASAPLLALSLLLPSLTSPPPASAAAAAALSAADAPPLVDAVPQLLLLAASDAELGYSQASYYTSLALFIISIPGLWSLIKRATKSKIVRRTFEVPGPASAVASGGKSMARVAGEITSSLNRNNYKVAEAKDVVTFEGSIQPSRSQAAFLVFCTALSLASVALVLSITNPLVGDWWYSIVALSPLAGVYYWRKAARTEQIQVKIVVSDDEQTADVIIQGDDEEIERLRRELNLMEKGLEYVKGIFES